MEKTKVIGIIGAMESETIELRKIIEIEKTLKVIMNYLTVHIRLTFM